MGPNFEAWREEGELISPTSMIVDLEDVVSVSDPNLTPTHRESVPAYG
jgi:hypothetical protein